MTFVNNEVNGSSKLFGLAVASKDSASYHGYEKSSESFGSLSTQTSFGKINNDFLAGVETFREIHG